MARKNKKSEHHDYILTFKNMCIDCRLDFDMFSQQERQDILNILRIMSREISIDKSYVQYKGTKYTKTFISESGWVELCSLLSQTHLGKKTTKHQMLELTESYIAMAICYLYQIFEDFGYDTSEIFLEFRDGSYFNTEIVEDKIREWEKYPGDWRTWNWHKIK